MKLVFRVVATVLFPLFLALAALNVVFVELRRAFRNMCIVSQVGRSWSRMTQNLVQSWSK